MTGSQVAIGALGAPSPPCQGTSALPRTSTSADSPVGGTSQNGRFCFLLFLVRLLLGFSARSFDFSLFPLCFLLSWQWVQGSV